MYRQRTIIPALDFPMVVALKLTTQLIYSSIFHFFSLLFSLFFLAVVIVGL